MEGLDSLVATAQPLPNLKSMLNFSAETSFDNCISRTMLWIEQLGENARSYHDGNSQY
jgi:hypothetical protein